MVGVRLVYSVRMTKIKDQMVFVFAIASQQRSSASNTIALSLVRHVFSTGLESHLKRDHSTRLCLLFTIREANTSSTIFICSSAHPLLGVLANYTFNANYCSQLLLSSLVMICSLFLFNFFSSKKKIVICTDSPPPPLLRPFEKCFTSICVCAVFVVAFFVVHFCCHPDDDGNYWRLHSNGNVNS